MAAAGTTNENSGIFWMNGVSDEEQPLAFVPGVDRDLIPGSTSLSSRRVTKMHPRRRSDCMNDTKKSTKKQGQSKTGRSGAYTKETKSKSTHHMSDAATEHTVLPALDSFLPPSQIISETSRTRSQICLKDLCSEDKRRIANLIEELARVSEEKEESVQRLKDEQENFERKIEQLEQQNLIIAQERESLQQQYKECQELLGLYQQYLSQQQAKLNQSIAQLSQAPAPGKVQSSADVPSRISTNRVDGALFDGSYLGLAAIQAQHPAANRTVDGRGAVQTCTNHDTLSYVSDISPTDGHIKQHRSQKSERSEPHSKSCHKCDHCQCSGQNCVCGSQQQRSYNGSCLENCHHDACNKYKHERLPSGNPNGLNVEQTLTRPLLGHEDWEEKRHQLLLQKMQLEMERERLQARLIEQDERLHRQNKQLQQTHLDYSRFQEATQADVNNLNSRTEDLQPGGPSNKDLPSSPHENAKVHLAEQHMHDSCSQRASIPRDNAIHTGEMLKQSKRDMATSPAKVSASMNKPTPLSAIQKTPDARLDFSVVELLDIFSPVSAPEQSKLSTRRTKPTQPKPAFASPNPVGSSLLTPARPYSQSTQQDLEESQILEDIFFIC